MRCYPLTWAQNGICLGIGAGGLLWGVLMKLVIRPNYFSKVKIEDKPLTDEERAEGGVMLIRKNSSLQRKPSSVNTVKQTKTTQALTSLIRQRSQLLKQAGVDSASYRSEEQEDKSTPAMNKLAAMMRGKAIEAKKVEEAADD